jgi:ornithine racemase
MGYPLVQIDLQKVTANTEVILDLCRPYGIEVVGVTKSFCADLAITKAMLAGGVHILGDSRVQNLRKLREAGITAPLMLLRIPMLSEAPEIVGIADYSLVSEIATAEALSNAAVAEGIIHSIILMVDMGDLREGVTPQKILPLVQQILLLPGIRLHGLGANFACYGGLIPTPEVLNGLLAVATKIRTSFSVVLPVVSGGNSANIELLRTGEIPFGITQLRIGEAILLGRETIERRTIPGAYQDAFTLYTEIVEVQEKPSVPPGETGQDAFGHRPTFIDRGIRKRAIAAIGRQDIAIEGLQPLQSGVEILGGSSDHLILDVSNAPMGIRVGSEMAFSMQYSALVQAMVSPYVSKVYSTVLKPALCGIN